MQPSLLVLIVGGWAQAASAPGNLFTSRQDGYLEELMASYPAVFIEPFEGSAKLERVYKALGTLALKEKTPLSLLEILHGHGLQE
jgi:hypothetical protein